MIAAVLVYNVAGSSDVPDASKAPIAFAHEYNVLLCDLGFSSMWQHVVCRTVLQAEMSGMNLSYECRRGNCTSCAAKVREGKLTTLTLFVLL